MFANDSLHQGVEFYDTPLIEVISTVHQETKEPMTQTKSLQQLKLEAQQEIQSVIQKHTALINSAGAMLNVTVNAYDAKGIMSLNQKQLIEVTATVTI